MSPDPFTLDRLFDSVPADVSAYFARIANGSFAGEVDFVQLLSSYDAVKSSLEFREFHPVAISLEGMVLDDPNTSNHHLYLSAPFCRGSIFYLSHDGDSSIVFESLNSMLTAAEAAIASEQSLDKFHPAAGVILPDQAGLVQYIRGLLDNEIEADGEALVPVLIPSLELTDFELLERLAMDPDNYVAEALSDAIRVRPRVELADIAKLCESHPHPQAARAGARAAAAIRAAHKGL